MISKKNTFAAKPISVFAELSKYDGIMYASAGTGEDGRADVSYGFMVAYVHISWVH